MVNLSIDNFSVNVLKNSTVLQACDSLGIDVPRFCFHERLLIAGNCRMCLVELEKSPKPVASCAFPVTEGMKVFTKTPLVKKAQEGVLEFLLLNHPLDCPICDQGGECDLQDQVMLFGSDSSRFYENKRVVEDKNCGPLIQSIMTRCIHCTRCVRFLVEVAGVQDLGTLGRGTNTQIGPFTDKIITSELSGNVIDLCPVGALTSKPYSFKARPWDVVSTNSIDLSDSCGSNIVINSKGNEVLRILPRLNESINEEWLSDKGRFCYDGLAIQRLIGPLFIDQNLKKINKIDWEKCFKIFFSIIYKDVYNLNKKLNILFGKDCDLETAVVVKYLFNKLNCFSLYSDFKYCSNSSDIFYRFNTQIKSIKDYDYCILVNSDARFEASMLNVHLRKGVFSGKLEVNYFGSKLNLAYESTQLGLNNRAFFDFLKGKHLCSKKLKESKNTLFIFNNSTFSNKELLFLNNLLSNIKKDSSFSLNVLNLDASSSGLRDLGIKGLNNILENTNNNSVYQLYLNTNLTFEQNSFFQKQNLVSIYSGSHGVKEANNSSLILPGRAFTEKKVNYMNLEGLVQNTNKSCSGLGNSRNDWTIFAAFFEFLTLNSYYIKLLNSNMFESFKFFFKDEYNFLMSHSYNYNYSFSNMALNSNYKHILFKNVLSYKLKIVNFYKTNILSIYSSILSNVNRSNSVSSKKTYIF